MMKKICIGVDVHSAVTCTVFGDDQLRGLSVARSQISGLPIDLILTLSHDRANM